MRFRLTLLGLPLCLTGCSGQQSALNPQGPHAEHLADLFWIFTAVCSAIWLAVMVVLLIGITRRAPARTDPLRLDRHRERRHVFVVSGPVVGTPLTVNPFTAGGLFSPPKTFPPGKPPRTT